MPEDTQANRSLRLLLKLEARPSVPGSPAKPGGIAVGYITVTDKKIVRFMMKLFKIVPGMLAIASLTVSPAAIAVEGGEWLDPEAMTNWNTPDATIPTAPELESNNFEYCERAIRAAQVPEDDAVLEAGWQLYGPIQLYGNTTIVTGMANADGMCRPMAHQAFVFVEGEFAGTLSPTPMDSRTDGNLYAIDLIQANYLRGAYQRYEPSDADCCPSSEDFLFFTIEEQEGSPVLVPGTATL